MVDGKFVEILFIPWKSIKGSRLVARVDILPTDLDAGAEQIKNGFARFREDKKNSISSFDRQKYKLAEKEAKSLKLGIWADEDL